MEPYQFTIRDIREHVKHTPSALPNVVQVLANRVAQVDKNIHAYLDFDGERAVAQASALANAKPLFGVPVSMKDNICTIDWETTCASRILRGYIPPYNATVIEKLARAGAFVFGKCNMDEFAFGSSCETSAFGPTHNPWDVARIPGGSSGGSAAAVAADEAICALGSDTGGSIRQPAAMCGVVGMKPTYGRVSRYGLIAFGSSLDQIGPLTKTVEDNAILLGVIAGHDPLDSTSANEPVPDYTQALKQDVKGLTIGLPTEYFAEGIQPDVDRAVRAAAQHLASLGARVVELSLPHTAHAVAVYYVVAVAEASSNLARFDGVQYGLRASSKDLRELYFETRDQGFGDEVKRRVLLGTFVLSHGYYDAYYLQAQKVRTLIKQDFDTAFEQCDILLTPTAPTTAFKLGEKLNDPLAMYLSDVCTIPVSLAGVPALSVPCGFDGQGLPIGAQFIGRHFDESTLFRAAYTFEQTTDYHKKKPTLPQQ